MTKLTDTQLIVLSSAAKHDEGLATKPINLHAAAAQKVASSLIDKRLVREIRAKADAPAWYENDGGRFALKITRAGREAIGVDDGLEDAASSPGIPAASDSKKDATKSARTRTAAQRKAIGGDAPSGQLRTGSKQAIIVDMMVRPKGATLDELIAATDWLPHTTRAALTGLRHRGYVMLHVIVVPGTG
jgi:hypothetical protein